jgi:hypothetical protein
MSGEYKRSQFWFSSKEIEHHRFRDGEMLFDDKLTVADVSFQHGALIFRVNVIAVTEWFATDLKTDQRVKVTSGFQQRYRCRLAIAADQLANGLEVTDYIRRTDWQPRQPNAHVWTVCHSGNPLPFESSAQSGACIIGYPPYEGDGDPPEVTKLLLSASNRDMAERLKNALSFVGKNWRGSQPF